MSAGIVIAQVDDQARRPIVQQFVERLVETRPRCCRRIPSTAGSRCRPGSRRTLAHAVHLDGFTRERDGKVFLRTWSKQAYFHLGLQLPTQALQPPCPWSAGRRAGRPRSRSGRRTHDARTRARRARDRRNHDSPDFCPSRIIDFHADTARNRHPSRSRDHRNPSRRRNSECGSSEEPPWPAAPRCVSWSGSAFFRRSNSHARLLEHAAHNSSAARSTSRLGKQTPRQREPAGQQREGCADHNARGNGGECVCAYRPLCAFCFVFCKCVRLISSPIFSAATLARRAP